MGFDEKGRQYIRATDTVIDLTLSVDTDAYADGDVLADTQELADVAQVYGDTVVLQSLTVLDGADQAQAMEFVFLDANKSLGTENSAPDITDANAASIIGCVSVSADDYTADLTASQVATVKNIGLVLKLNDNSKDLYVGVLSGGTGTYAASDIKCKFGFLR